MSAGYVLPSLSEVIPAMDIIDETLTNHSLDTGLQPAIRAAVNLAKKTMNRYYNRNDASECYRIAMSKFHSLRFSIIVLTLAL